MTRGWRKVSVKTSDSQGWWKRKEQTWFRCWNGKPLLYLLALRICAQSLKNKNPSIRNELTFLEDS